MSNLIKLKQIDGGVALQNAVAEHAAALQTLENETIPELIVASKAEVYERTSDEVSVDTIAADITAKAGDVLIVTNSNGVKSAYHYDTDADNENGKWIACDGNVDATKVILKDNIVLAGNYSSVGNITKSEDGQSYPSAGKSVAEVLTKMLSQVNQPSITSEPSVSISLSGAGAKEVGSTFSISYTASFDDGAYTYEDTTGAEVTTWKVTDSDGHESSSRTGAFGEFKSFQVTEDTNYKVTAQATYSDGSVAVDNLGNPSNPEVKIEGNTITSAASTAVTGYRSWFYGYKKGTDTLLDVNKLTSANIRALTAANGSFKSSMDTTAMQQMFFAAPAGKVTKVEVINSKNDAPQTVQGPVTVKVEGAAGYTAIDYDVFYVSNAGAEPGAVNFTIKTTKA